MDKTEILVKIEQEYDALRKFIGLSISECINPVVESGEWSAKDILAHIAAWENVLRRFHIGGEPFEDVIEMPGARYHVTTFDEINAHLFKKYESWSVEKVRRFAEDSHEAVMEKLEELTEQEYQEPAASIAAIGLDPYALYEYIAANTYDHYVEHMEILDDEG